MYQMRTRSHGISTYLYFMCSGALYVSFQKSGSPRQDHTAPTMRTPQTGPSWPSSSGYINNNIYFGLKYLTIGIWSPRVVENYAGWCRVERTAAVLSRTDKPILVHRLGLNWSFRRSSFSGLVAPKVMMIRSTEYLGFWFQNLRNMGHVGY